MLRMLLCLLPTGFSRGSAKRKMREMFFADAVRYPVNFCNITKPQTEATLSQPLSTQNPQKNRTPNQKSNPKQTPRRSPRPREGTPYLHQKIKVKMVSATEEGSSICDKKPTQKWVKRNGKKRQLESLKSRQPLVPLTSGTVIFNAETIQNTCFRRQPQKSLLQQSLGPRGS